MGDSITEWLKSGKYLPEPLRDFHDQKAVFKAMHANVREQPLVRRPDWIEGQVYVIDLFLWYMAQHGWTLQRTRRAGEYLDLAESTRKHEQTTATALLSALTARAGS